MKLICWPVSSVYAALATVTCSRGLGIPTASAELLCGAGNGKTAFIAW